MKSYLCVYVQDGVQNYWNVPIKTKTGKTELKAFEDKLSEISASGAEILLVGMLTAAEMETIQVVEKVKLKVDNS